MDEFEMIEQLMSELKEKMQYGGDELSERLGRPKPKVEVMEMEGEIPTEECEDMDPMEMVEESMPEAGLKKRLMKLRGK